MTLTLDELDGKYQVSSAPVESPTRVDGDGTTEIKNGLTYRKDKKGLIWESAFSIIDATHVAMESTVDPSHAGDAVYIHDEKGNPTKGMLTYRTVLEATRAGGKLVLSGIIEHGQEKTRLTLTKI